MYRTVRRGGGTTVALSRLLPLCVSNFLGMLLCSCLVHNCHMILFPGEVAVGGARGCVRVHFEIRERVPVGFVRVCVFPTHTADGRTTAPVWMCACVCVSAGTLSRGRLPVFPHSHTGGVQLDVNHCGSTGEGVVGSVRGTVTTQPREATRACPQQNSQ